jgi:signal transduction histidine kinase
VKTIQRLRPALIVGLTFATVLMVFFNLSRPETPFALQVMSIFVGALIILGLFGLIYLEEEWRKQAKALQLISDENVRLYTQKSQRADQLSTLHRVTTLLTETLSPNEVLDAIASSVGMVSDAHAVAVYLYDAETGKFSLSRQTGFIEDWDKVSQQPLLADQINKTLPVIVADTLSDSRTVEWLHDLAREGKRALIELPILHKGNLDGAIGLFFNQTRLFGSEYLDIVQAFATQAGYALANARAYEDTDKALGVTTENLKAIMDARETYTQMVVHDLRSPLTAVTTSLTLLTELMPKNAEHATLIQRTTDLSKRAIRKVLTRVDGMLDIAKMESGEILLDREPTNLASLVDNVYHELLPIAEDLEIKIKPELAPNLPMLYVDADKIERMILNLTDNALKYAPLESQISIRAHQQDMTYVRLEVIDHGQGIPDEYKQRLFDRFVQVEGRQVVRRGVGLGLSFCKLVAEAHGGKIWIEDNPDGGSIFVVTLPILIPTEKRATGELAKIS